ncbi:MAG: hypothetical protein QG670_2092 [Thermoproteota archaeon]|nr:hypothetical protein [Thermoproteota archaeon]
MRMPKSGYMVILVLLIPFSFLANLYVVGANKQENVDSSIKIEQIVDSSFSTKLNSVRAKVVEHSITSFELEKLKSKFGLNLSKDHGAN